MTARTNTEPLTPSALDAVPVQQPGRPTLFVVVDTEEEFDWRAPLSREQTSVRAMRNIHLLQSLLTAASVKPTYVIDYPVATQRDGYGPLLDFHRSGEAEIGAHLHPWVTPPLDEQLTSRNSFGFRLGQAGIREAPCPARCHSGHWRHSDDLQGGPLRVRRIDRRRAGSPGLRRRRQHQPAHELRR
jgi:hypothetical protein